MKPIEEIISSLRIAMTDARQSESHFESWMILNEAICDAIEALAEQPASKPWVGLTDDDLDDIATAAKRGNLYDLRLAIEAKLKDKNA